jgi:hypothetical protein
VHLGDGEVGKVLSNNAVWVFAILRAWKLRVEAKLKENEKAGIKPASIAELARLLPGGKPEDKAGLYRALDPDGVQRSSKDVDAICELLGIGPPLVESDEDEELQGDLEVIRSLSPDARRELMVALIASIGGRNG